MQQIGRTRPPIMDAGGLNPRPDLPFSPSQLMKDFIQGAKDYHCGGCLSAPTLMNKYLNFIFSPDPNADNPFRKKPKKQTGNGINR